MDHEKERALRHKNRTFTIVAAIGFAAIVFYGLHTVTELDMTLKIGIAVIVGILDWLFMQWFVGVLARGEQLK